jgi:TATA-box binding protein (TBP) (component of TFIID and TFIIIB)
MDLTKFNPSPLRVSTRVITANAGSTLDLKMLFNSIHVALVPLWWPGEGILKMEHEKAVIGLGLKDAFSKRRVSDKIFLNQSTLVVRKRIDVNRSKHTTYSDDSMIFKEVNVKLFANGGIQMTGVPDESFAERVLVWLLETLNKIDAPIFKESPKLNKFSTQLINSDYDVGYTIKRETIHQILIRTYGLFSTFEGTIYQGVNTKYYYNDANTDPDKAGQCVCKGKCKGQGSGSGDGECKRITMSIFQTGKIIITGARYYHQIQEAYDYLNRVIKDHADEVLRAPIPAAATLADDSDEEPVPATTKKVRKTRVRKICLSP